LLRRWMDWQWSHENSRTTVLEIFAIKRKLDLRRATACEACGIAHSQNLIKIVTIEKQGD
ncbi:hypothetical protein COX84_03135, partial [Candidatus Micrarchaeota archaeon CG_4_10_14_0_2_um_filter_49_7]